MRSVLILLLCLLACRSFAQDEPATAVEKKKYLADLKPVQQQFTAWLYPSYTAIYSLPEQTFVSKIDSARQAFQQVLDHHAAGLDPAFRQEEQAGIRYYFDKLLVEYPLTHDVYLGKTSHAGASILRRLKSDLSPFNDPALLGNRDFTDYVRSFLYYHVVDELKKARYRNSDNKQLDAVWTLLPQYFSNPQCRNFWLSEYLYRHIDDNGIKHIERIYQDFRNTCTDTTLLRKVAALYREDAAGRTGHLVKSYKTVGPFTLDMHLFLPGDLQSGNKRPVIVFFHGGSWTEGKPDWFFDSCAAYAKRGWIACAVEYRTYARHRTLPFAAVMDARSAIRWIRQHAGEYHIDTSRVVASGNSAGGHLVLCAALASQWNEKTDDRSISPAPNLMLINSGVYDLTDPATAWIRKDMKNKGLVNQISPVWLIRADMPPALIIHGTNDQNVPYQSAKQFVEKMEKAGNRTIQFETLQGAGHFIWFVPEYARQVVALRQEFLRKYGY